jgi:hypothetical protein
MARLRRGGRFRLRRDDDRRDFREGFPFDGRWVAPEEAHETCRRRMEALDREPREVRDRVNEFGH